MENSTNMQQQSGIEKKEFETNINDLVDNPKEKAKQQAIKETKKTKEISRFQTESKAKDFYDKKRSKYKLAKFVMNVTQPISGLLEGLFLYYHINNFTNIFWLSVLLTAVIVGVFEYGKRVIVIDYFKDRVKNDLNDDKESDSTIIVVIAFTLISVVASFFGGNIAVKIFSKPAPTLHIDDVANINLELIADLDKQIALQERDVVTHGRDKGQIRDKAQRQINRLSKQKSDLQTKVSNASDTLKTTNKTIIEAHSSSIQQSGIITGGISTVLEFCFLWAVWFYHYYRFTCGISVEEKTSVIIDISDQQIQRKPSPTLPDEKDIKIQILESNIKQLAQQTNFLLTAQTNQSQALPEAKSKNKSKSKSKKKKPKEETKERPLIWFGRNRDDNNLGAKIQGDTTGEKITQQLENEQRDDFNSQVTKIINIENSKVCKHCNKQYIYNHKKQIYCCEKCRKAAYKAKRRNKATLKK